MYLFSIFSSIVLTREYIRPGTIKSATMKETKQAWDAWTRRIVAKSGKRRRGDTAISLSSPPPPTKEERRRCCYGMCSSLEDIFDAGVTPSEGILRGGLFVFLVSLMLYALQYFGYHHALEYGKYARDQALTYENIVMFSTLLIIYLLASILHHFRRARQQLAALQRQNQQQSEILVRLLRAIRDA